jgi:hypothetical protein
MDVYVYQENSRKIKGEDVLVLLPIGTLEGFESVEEAMEALIDSEPDYMGVELVIFTEEPQYITAEEPPPTKYSFVRRNGSGAVVEEPEAEGEEPEAEPEEEAPAPAARRRPAAKKAASRKPAAKKRPGSRAGTRAGAGGRKSPFTRNAASAD